MLPPGPGRRRVVGGEPGGSSAAMLPCASAGPEAGDGSGLRTPAPPCGGLGWAARPAGMNRASGQVGADVAGEVNPRSRARPPTGSSVGDRRGPPSRADMSARPNSLCKGATGPIWRTKNDGVQRPLLAAAEEESRPRLAGLPVQLSGAAFPDPSGSGPPWRIDTTRAGSTSVHCRLRWRGASPRGSNGWSNDSRGPTSAYGWAGTNLLIERNT